MVFVFSLITIAIIILPILTSLHLFIDFTSKLTVNLFKIKFGQYFNAICFNIVYIYIFFFFLSFCTIQSSIASLLIFIYLIYSQKFLRSPIDTETLATNVFDFKKGFLTTFFSTNFLSKHHAVCTDIYNLVREEALKFPQMFKDSIQDIKVAFFLVEPTFKLTKAQKALYTLQKNFFKYKKVEEIQNDPNLRTDEDVLKLYNFLKRLRDPRETFNPLRRLPWKFNYTQDTSIVFKLLSSNILVFYNFFKTTLVALILTALYFLYTIFFFKIQFLKQLSVWFVICMLYFWLMSGFNFFLKRYQYSKFTSQIQRFWKRTNTYFWLIEGFLLLLFFYYYLNSSQEPLYMYDYSSLNLEYLVPLHSIGINIIFLSLVIYFMYFTLLRINSNSWTQLSLYLLVISGFIFFSFFIETYQFYYVISVFNERLWVFNEEENLWVIDVDNPIMRTKHQYLLVCLIAKYWHFLFIFVSWVFFLIKSFERRKLTYVLFGANLQNMIILYALNFACYLQWFKWIYRRFFDLPYTWFFVSIDNKFFFRVFFEIKLLVLNIFSLNPSFMLLNKIVYKSLFLWNVDSLCMWKFL